MQLLSTVRHSKGIIGLASWNARVEDVAAVLKVGKTHFTYAKGSE